MSKNKQQTPRPAGEPASSGRTSPAAATNRREQLRAQQEAEAQRARARRIITAVAVVVAVIIVAVVVVVLVQSAQRKREQQGLQPSQGQIVPPNANADKSGLVFNNSSRNTGTPQVEVYLDYQCPACGQASKSVDPLLEQLADAGELQLSYHMLFGLDRGFPGNHSFRAALAGTCADVQGLFPTYSKTVFANQPPREGDGWTDEQLRATFAQQAGLSGEALSAFQACFDTRATSDFVNGMQEAKPAYVGYTPFFAVNGKELKLTNTDLASVDAMRAAIERAAG